MTEVKILGISGSHRKGATEFCVQEALRVAGELPGVATEFVSLRGKTISHCVHCNRCVREKRLCTIEDDFQKIYDKFLAADGYIIGTPVYQMSATPLLQDFLSRIRPTFVVHPGAFTNRVGGAIATGGTRHGGQEMTNLVINNFYKTYEILVTGGPGGNYSGACVWTKDNKEQGAREDEVGMTRVWGLGRRVAEVALILKAGRQALAAAGVEFKQEDFWAGVKERYATIEKKE